MAKFKICEFCGAHLDYNEKCDCQNQSVIVRNGTASNVFVYTNANSGTVPDPVKRTA